MEKYNNPCPMNTLKNQIKIRKAHLDKYGVEFSMQRKEVYKKSVKTNLERYGVKSILQLTEKMKQSVMDIYGVDNVSKVPFIRQKALATNFERYGFIHAMQNSFIAKKSMINSKRYKIYILPSGKEIKIQGYENFTLDVLLIKYNETELLTDRTDMPEIWYILNGSFHRYYPDIFIPIENKIIEVKSTWTYNLDIKQFHNKKKACEYLGYTFESYIYNSKKERIYMYI
jgi:hypothetical protein